MMNRPTVQVLFLGKANCGEYWEDWREAEDMRNEKRQMIPETADMPYCRWRGFPPRRVSGLDCRLLLCLVSQEVTTEWWYEYTNVEQILEHWRADKLLKEVKNDKGKTKVSNPKVMIQKLFLKVNWHDEIRTEHRGTGPGSCT